MAKHTPGPWKLQKVEECHNGYADWQTFAVRSQQNICLCVVGAVDRFESERIPANARLIAAAPQLAEALRAVVVLLDRLREVDSKIPASANHAQSECSMGHYAGYHYNAARAALKAAGLEE